MTNSGGYNNADNKAEEEGMSDAQDATAMTEDGEIDTGANSNDIFSDSAPGENNSAAGAGSESEDDSAEDSAASIGNHNDSSGE